MRKVNTCLFRTTARRDFSKTRCPWIPVLAVFAYKKRISKVTLYKKFYLEISFLLRKTPNMTNTPDRGIENRGVKFSETTE